MKWSRRIGELARSKSGLAQRIRKNFSISLVGAIVGAIVGIGQTAVLTKSLGSAVEYGRLMIVINLFSFLIPFLGVRTKDLVFRYYTEFEEAKSVSSLRGLIGLSLAISVGFVLVLTLGSYVAAPWMAERLYEDPDIARLFRIYAAAMLFVGFEDVFTSVLRIKDRFTALVVPQIASRLLLLLALVVYFWTHEGYDLAHVVWLFVAAQVVRCAYPLALSIRLMRRDVGEWTGGAWRDVRARTRQYAGVLFQTNLTGYLKLASAEGGIFLLGVLAGPTQVAMYSIAKQLTKPLVMLQQNVQAVVTPEITSLWAKKELRRLHRFIRRLALAMLGVGGVMLVGAFILAGPLLRLIATPEYIEALPVFYLFFATYYVTFVSLAFYPLALVMDKLGWRNLIVSIRFVYLGIAVWMGLSAWSLALSQLGGAVTTRIFNDLPLLRSLRKRADAQAQSIAS